MARTFLFVVAVATCCALRAQEDRLSIHFATASATLDELARGSLTSLCVRAGEGTIISVTLSGHTDNVGNALSNEVLSRRRLEAVRHALKDQCPSLATAVVRWNGEEAPVADNADPDGRALNRRVDIDVVRASGITEELPGASSNTAAPYVHPLVRPLLPEADKVRAHFQVDASAAIELYTADGVRIQIPAGAVVRADGTPADGLIDLAYRSFDEPWEMLASGIPMHVGEGPDAGHMESAGMFELYASQHGERLALREGETISLSRTVDVPIANDYHDFMLDEATGRWAQVPRPDNGQATTSSQEASRTTSAPSALMVYWRALSDLPSAPDTLSFLERLGSDRYCHTQACSPTSKPYIRLTGRISSPYKDKNIPAIQVEIAQRDMRVRGGIAFMIVFDRSSQHSEWQVFPENKLWVYNGSLGRKQLRERIARKHFYQDVHLEALPGDRQGVIRLKDRGTWIELPVDLSVYQQREQDAKQWNEELRNYQGRFMAKKRRFDKRLEAKNNEILSRIRNRERKAWREARPFMDERQLAMSETEWHAFAKAFRPVADPFGQEQAAQVAEQFIASYSMRSFGIYNCDRLIRNEAVPTLVTVTDTDGASFPWSMAYGILEGRKAIITYWGQGKGTGDGMVLSKDMNTVLFVCGDGRMVTVDHPVRNRPSGALMLTGTTLAPTMDAKALEALSQR